MTIFLGLNGWDLEAPEDEVVTTMVAVAGRRRSERALANWVKTHMIRLR